MRIHTYSAGGGAATTVEAEPTTTLREILVIEAEERVYRVGNETEVDLELTVVELFGERPGHVLRHPCRTVAVTVTYGGIDTVIKEHPAALLRTVRTKAIDEFKIPPSDAADLVLRLAGSDVDLSLIEPVGAVTAQHTCAAALDLVHPFRPQG